MNWLKLLFCLILCIESVISTSLDGIWKGLIRNINYPARVPGGVYSDLEKNGNIKKNLADFNDLQNRWIANESVYYVTNIEADDTLLKAPHAILIFHGLDTFSTIYINNVTIGKTSNMFLRYSFDIRDKLKKGNNELKVTLESSVKVAENLYNLQSTKYVVPPKCVPKEYHGECHVNHIRKMQASYGWDWGPAFPSMGIWRSVELKPVHTISVSDITVDVRKTNVWQMEITAFLDFYGKNDGIINESAQLTCSLMNIFKNRTINQLKVQNNQANITVLLEVPLDAVDLWWPNGYGKQNLYELNVSFVSGEDVTSRQIKVGFRTAKLIQKPLTKGLSFYFEVNGVPIFAKGSNWIPSSVFPEHLENEEKLRYLLQSAKDTHMNMLRVWGGGVYESDLFYSIADEYGIMIWQDFMFACSMYPTASIFLDSVKEEVIQNMRRLKYHPSIVLWAGNNENEAALYGNWYGTGTAEIYKKDYVKLYVDVIKNEAEKIDISRPFVVSSPSNGLYSEEQNYTESNPYSNFYGDVHYYNYLLNGWDINQYPITRFASEYGFQAWPSISTLKSASESLNDTFLNHRQHLPGGNAFMKLLISKNFEIPDNKNEIENLKSFIYLSQVNQAVSMRTQTESYRQMKSSFNDLDEGMTMGALYWQLNDVWQAPSWSSIDFEGRWKMLHYYVKDFFSPVIITSRVTQANELLVYVVSDLLKNLVDLTAEMKIYQWESSKFIFTSRIRNITLDPNESRVIYKGWLNNFLKDNGCGPLEKTAQNCMIELVLKDNAGKIIAPKNYVYPSIMKKIPKSDSENVGLQIRIKENSTPGEVPNQLDFPLNITSKKRLLFVWLELENIVGRFSENGFHLLDNEKSVVFHAYQSTTAQDILSNLSVTSFPTIYNSQSPDVQIHIDC